jgi:GTP-binding protein Era
VNKVDLGNQEKVANRLAFWQEKIPDANVFPISALHGFNIDGIWENILAQLPESPAYYDKDEISDRPMRFFISEIIREKIFLHCKKEVPYACQVEIEEYKEEPEITRIRALIIVERDTQRGIIIGKGGDMLKRIGRDARLEIEKFIDQKVFLETYVKVDKDLRTSDQKLKKYGY